MRQHSASTNQLKKRIFFFFKKKKIFKTISTNMLVLISHSVPVHHLLDSSATTSLAPAWIAPVQNSCVPLKIISKTSKAL